MVKRMSRKLHKVSRKHSRKSHKRSHKRRSHKKMTKSHSRKSAKKSRKSRKSRKSAKKSRKSRKSAKKSRKSAKKSRKSMKKSRKSRKSKKSSRKYKKRSAKKSKRCPAGQMKYTKDGKKLCKPNPAKYAGKLSEVAAESREAEKAYEGGALAAMFGQRIKRRMCKSADKRKGVVVKSHKRKGSRKSVKCHSRRMPRKH